MNVNIYLKNLNKLAFLSHHLDLSLAQIELLLLQQPLDMRATKNPIHLFLHYFHQENEDVLKEIAITQNGNGIDIENRIEKVKVEIFAISICDPNS